MKNNVQIPDVKLRKAIEKKAWQEGRCPNQ